MEISLVSSSISDSGNWFVFQNEKVIIAKNCGDTKLKTASINLFKNNFIRTFSFTNANDVVSHCAELDSHFSIPDPFESISLRSALTLVDEEGYHAIARAYSIIRWDKIHHYCGQCA